MCSRPRAAPPSHRARACPQRPRMRRRGMRGARIGTRPRSSRGTCGARCACPRRRPSSHAGASSSRGYSSSSSFSAGSSAPRILRWDSRFPTTTRTFAGTCSTARSTMSGTRSTPRRSLRSSVRRSSISIASPSPNTSPYNAAAKRSSTRCQASVRPGTASRRTSRCAPRRRRRKRIYWTSTSRMRASLSSRHCGCKRSRAVSDRSSSELSRHASTMRPSASMRSIPRWAWEREIRTSSQHA